MQTRRSFLRSIASAFVAAAVSLELVRETFPSLSYFDEYLHQLYAPEGSETKLVFCGPNFLKVLDDWVKTGGGVV